MSVDQARSKQTTVTGGDVNYYLVDCMNAVHGPKCVAEVEDMIEACDQRFSEANVFKATVRLCKLRMDLGKPGSDAVYESAKGVYYSDRSLVRAKRRAAATGETLNHEPYDLERLYLVVVDEPKRLEPYSVDIRDFTDALGATEDEAALIHTMLLLSRLQMIPRDTTSLQVELAERGTILARAVNAAAAIDATTKAVTRKVDGMALLKALLGAPIDDEVRATRGRFGWLEALVDGIRDNLSDADYRHAFEGEDASAAYECLDEVEALAKEVRARLDVELAA